MGQSKGTGHPSIQVSRERNRYDPASPGLEMQPRIPRWCVADFEMVQDMHKDLLVASSSP